MSGPWRRLPQPPTPSSNTPGCALHIAAIPGQIIFPGPFSCTHAASRSIVPSMGGVVEAPWVNSATDNCHESAGTATQWKHKISHTGHHAARQCVQVRDAGAGRVVDVAGTARTVCGRAVGGAPKKRKRKNYTIRIVRSRKHSHLPLATMWKRKRRESEIASRSGVDIIEGQKTTWAPSA